MKNVLIADFGTETNTFNPSFTEMAAFGGDMADTKGIAFHRGKLTAFGAFIDTLEAYCGIQIIESVHAGAAPWGPVRRNVYDLAEKIILSAIDDAKRIDGVLLCLHGAMVLEDDDDAEGLLLEAIRTKIGHEIPIMVKLDLHANITEKMLNNATAFFINDLYPHSDSYDRCVEAAHALLAVFRWKSRPIMRAKQLPMLAQFIPTTDPRIKKYLDAMHEYEKDPRVITVSVAYGFFCADIHESGLRVIAVTNDAPDLAQKIADELADAIWQDRRLLVRQFDDLETALDTVAEQTDGPYVFADCCDNPGGGSPGSSTHILRQLLARDISGAAVASIYDPDVVAQAEKAGIGSWIDVSLGGKMFPEILGAAIEAKAYVKAITDGRYSNTKDPVPAFGAYGKNVVLQIGKVEVIVITALNQTFSPDLFRANGIDPLQKRLLVVKSTIAFRKEFEPIAKRIFDILVPGLAYQQQQQATHVRCRRPIWPLDDI